MDQDNDYLIGKTKAVCIDKAKRGIHSLLLTARQMSSHFPGSRVLVHITVA